MTRRRVAWVVGAAVLLSVSFSLQIALAQLAQTPLPGKGIPKYVEPLATFVGNRVNGTHPLQLIIKEFQQAVLPSSVYAALPPPYDAGTYVWGYKIVDLSTSVTYGPHFPSFSIEAERGTPTAVTFINDLVDPKLEDYLVVDQTIHWAAPTGMDMMNMSPYDGPVPIVVHLHGGEVPSAIDGGPDAWFTPNSQGPPEYVGSAYNQTVNGNPVGNTYTYPNTQEPATLWYHDHTLGATRLNVYAGLAGFYLLRGGSDTGPGNSLGLPADPYEIEMAIQDRMFDVNGQLLFPNEGINPMVHPFWIPEFFGDAIVVNGKTWPYLTVEPRRYRFRVLNGCNARFLALSFGNGGPVIWQIGTDGGLLDAPVQIAYPKRLFLAPGERADIIVDFAKFASKTFIMDNTAKAPYPAGTPPDPQTVGQIMQFRVGTTTGTTDQSFNPATPGIILRSTPLVKLVNFASGTAAVTPNIKRRLTLNEVMGMEGPLEVLVNNTKWTGELSPNAGGTTELPQQGATELWEIVNLTADAHPIHLHLVQFQLLNRQDFQTNKYVKAYGAAFPGGLNPFDQVVYPQGVYMPAYGPPLPYNSTTGYLGGNPDVTQFLQGKATPADPNEAGWKDTFKMFPGQVTRVLVRFAPTDVPAGTTTAGTNYFAFDPTEGPGYVWHCHIIDHEDNEMMRPYRVMGGAQASIALAANVAVQAMVNAVKPINFELAQNVPNPFNPTTEISFSLAEDSHVLMRIYNALGQEVQTLIDGDTPAGRHTFRFDATNLSSGIYFYRIQAGGYVASKKMVVVK